MLFRSAGELAKVSRKQEIVDARRVFFLVALAYGYSPKQAAALLGKDRTTLLNSIDKFRDEYSYSTVYRYRIDTILEKLNMYTDGKHAFVKVPELKKDFAIS